MSKPEYVIAPEGCQSYLTPGKRYEVSNFCANDAYRGTINIAADNGSDIFCLLEKCPHLNNGDWIIPGADDVAAPEVTIDAVSVADIEIQRDGDNLLINQGMQTVYVYGRNIPALISALQLMVKK